MTRLVEVSIMIRTTASDEDMDNLVEGLDRYTLGLGQNADSELVQEDIEEVSWRIHS